MAKPGYFTFENIAKAKTYGSELALGYRPSGRISLNLNWSELRIKDKKTGRELSYNPKRIITAGLDWQATSRLNAGISLKHVGSQNYDADSLNPAGRAASYTLANLNAAYLFGKNMRSGLYGGIDNLFDRKVNKRLGSDVGTYYYAGFKYAF